MQQLILHLIICVQLYLLDIPTSPGNICSPIYTLLQMYICTPMYPTYSTFAIVYLHQNAPQCTPLLQMYICTAMYPSQLPYFYKYIFVPQYTPFTPLLQLYICTPMYPTAKTILSHIVKLSC